jgi:hypothetical protein
MSSSKQYVINVDFYEWSRLHLNPYYYNAMWCHLDKEKKPRDGGKMFVTREEAIAYLSNRKRLIFNNRIVTNLITCKNCSKLKRQRVYWNI